METPLGWEMREGKLVRKYTFATFIDAIKFIVQVADVAEGLNHHPEIFNSYTNVTLSLFTHDLSVQAGENAVTQKDRELAEVINKIAP